MLLEQQHLVPSASGTLAAVSGPGPEHSSAASGIADSPCSDKDRAELKEPSSRVQAATRLAAGTAPELGLIMNLFQL
jgi:hypothetical protein